MTFTENLQDLGIAWQGAKRVKERKGRVFI